MKSISKLPCKKCIALAMCKSRFNQLLNDGIAGYSTYQHNVVPYESLKFRSMCVLIQSCRPLEEYLFKNLQYEASIPSLTYYNERKRRLNHWLFLNYMIER